MKATEKIGKALVRIRAIAKENRAHIIRSHQMQRADRELLVRTKWLQEIVKGWYLLVKPEHSSGDSSTWYANFWDFLRIYLNYHFGNNYCLSAENSLDLHTGSTMIPKQVIAISAQGGGPLQLPFNTSIFVYANPSHLHEERTTIYGLNVMSLPYALCKVSPSYFKKNPKDAQIALRLIKTPSDLTQIILKYNFKSSAARLMGAYDFLGSQEIIEVLVRDFAALGWKIKGENPFSEKKPLLPAVRLQSPYTARILSLWGEYREKIIRHFPRARGVPKNPKAYLARVKDLYERDAYNSLSIEGYQVDEDLIARVQGNRWNPDLHAEDEQTRNALAARGYYEAFLEVKKSLHSLFQGKNPGEVVKKDLSTWYQKLFSPLVRAGVIPNVIQKSEFRLRQSPDLYPFFSIIC